ncbi:unnamed protein product [Nesidiocoris tenuis]|uniref:Uncharacterized protein n=1 Tax=Nesidiocoris tenuis TaxID=355587 RepID=A0A6H5GEP7_9HEMI|nr:unnamed protein product [Nesidiocoris tenuis]
MAQYENGRVMIRNGWSPGSAGLSASAESVTKRSCVRRNSSRSRHNRPASRRNKENGSKSLQKQTASLDGNQPLMPNTLSYKPRI